MTKFFQSAFVPIIVIALLVFLFTSSSSSVPGFVGAILPFLLLIGFWVFLRKNVLSRRKPAQEPLKTDGTDMKALAKRIGLDG